MGNLIEAFILYIVLFFSGAARFIIGGERNVDFSAAGQIAGILLHSIPSLALIMFLMHRAGRIDKSIIKPGKKDLICGLITLPCLLLIGIVTASVSYFTGSSDGSPSLSSPSTVPGWIILCLSCVCAAYLEESYFRYYLLTARAALKLNDYLALLLSTALFSICHIYEGPLGVLNAALSGALLCIIFLRRKSFHGIALAHGFYNILIYMFFNHE